MRDLRSAMNKGGSRENRAREGKRKEDDIPDWKMCYKFEGVYGCTWVHRD